VKRLITGKSRRLLKIRCPCIRTPPAKIHTRHAMMHCSHLLACFLARHLAMARSQKVKSGHIKCTPGAEDENLRWVGKFS